MKPIDTFVALAVLSVLVMSELHSSTPLGWETALSVHIKIKNVAFLCLFVALWPALLSTCGIYDISIRHSALWTFGRAILACGVGAVLISVFTVLTDSTARPFPTMLGFWCAASVATAGVHWLIRGGIRLARYVSGRPSRKHVLVVGSGGRAVYHAHVLEQESECVVIGFVDKPWPGVDPIANDRWLGDIDELELILMRTVVDEVVIALPIKSCYGDIQHAISACERLGVQSKCIVDYFCPDFASPQMAQSGDVPAVAMSVVTDDSRRFIKRALDVCCAAIALVVLAPAFLAIALAVKLTSPGPVLFAQERYGYQKRRFMMYKFRSMVTDAERLMAQIEHLNEAQAPVFKIRNDPRLTPVGRFLRRTSLDELPQLFNVLKGEMSLVGPRPLSARDVQQFAEPWLMRRFSVQPGLTCTWQVSGRSSLSFHEWINLDLEYIDRWTLRLDFEILARTIPAVLRGEGAM